MSKTDDTFGIVWRRRRQLGLSWRKAAATSGLSLRTWAEIELCDGGRGSDDDLAKVEAALNITPGVLKAFNTEVADPEHAEIRRELIDLVQQLVTPEKLAEPVLVELRGRLEDIQARLQAAEG